MALVQMMKSGLLKYIISPNCDTLHRKSGIPSEKISECHGNPNLEICTKCKKDYMRDKNVRKAGILPNEHLTGNKCDDPECKGALKDSIINYGDNLDE